MGVQIRGRPFTAYRDPSQTQDRLLARKLGVLLYLNTLRYSFGDRPVILRKATLKELV
jgi:hypothetical protein